MGYKARDVTSLLGGVYRVCQDCGETKPLELFHKNKACNLGHTSTCRDCEWDRRKQWYKDNRDRRRVIEARRGKDRKLRVIKERGDKCFDCGNTYHPAVYQFHHIDNSLKDMNPSAAFKMSKERMEKELANCVMLCANCHMIRHWSDSYINEGMEEENDA